MKYERLTERAENGKPYFDGCLHCDLEMDCGLCPYWGSGLNRLAELEDDLESGKIVRLPCNVCDKLYKVMPVCGVRRIVEFEVHRISIYSDEICIFSQNQKVALGMNGVQNLNTLEKPYS